MTIGKGLYSVSIYAATLFFMTIIFPMGKTDILSISWIILCIAALIFAASRALKRRKCGHGPISQDANGFYWPFVIDPCPHCGEYTFDE